MSRTSRKIVTNDELARLIVRIEDVNESAIDLAKRLHANGGAVDQPIDRVATCLEASATLTDLANGMLRSSWLAEQKQKPAPAPVAAPL